MTRRIALFALLASIMAPAFAADDALPTPEAILNRYVEVTGGRAAYEKRTSEIASGSVEYTAQGLKGTLNRYAAAPDKMYTVIEFEGVGKFEQGSADGIAWEKSAMLGPRVKSGVEKSQAIRESVFNHELNWKKLYDKAETVGVETIDGEECYKVVLTPADGHAETTYYQKKSGLAVKSSVVAASQMGDISAELMVSDYKNFDGILMPSKMVQRAAGQDIVMTIQTVKVNQEIPAGRFEPPPDIKALLAKPADAAPNK
ncbi:MAG TPA: outer membrane lipoprotein-sorting protein [Bryobacteraceae bacterium]|nr:outer membrane lipoprotein-sorting protein [Bryobacteraceae bacterium]